MTEIIPGGAAVLVGMNNPYGADPRYALYPLPENSAGGRLFAMLQMVRPQTKFTEYRDAFERVNLCAGEFNRREARERAGELRRQYDGRTILLG